MRRAAGLGIIVVLMLSVMAGTAVASHNEGSKRLRFEDCLDPDGGFGNPMDCTYDEDGHLISQPGSGGGNGISFGTLIFLGLLWSLIPVIIAVNIASARSQSVAGAALIALVGGWLGLAIVYFGMREGSPVEKVLSPTPAAGPRQGSVTANQSSVEERSAADRLRELQNLRDQGLITEEEFTTRRAAIVSEI